MTKSPDTPPSGVPASTVSDTTPERDPGGRAECRPYGKRAAANGVVRHVRGHRVAWTEPNVDHAAAARRKADGAYAVRVGAARIKEDDR